jgi:putative drug exporter of the RND superfamily
VSLREVTSRVARWSATHPWTAIIAWVLVVIACSMLGSVVSTNQATPLQLGVGQSGQAAQIENTGGLTDPAVENVLITFRAGSSTAAQAQAAARSVRTGMSGLPAVAHVAAPVPAASGRTLLVQITMRGDPNTATNRVQPLLNETASVQRAYPRLTVEETGASSISNGLSSQLGADFKKAESISLPITLLILLVVFGAFLAAGIPILLALSAVVSALGLSAVASHAFPDNGLVANVILMMGLAVGIDYSLFYLRREREERAAGASRLDAIEIAAATSGQAVVVSALAVIVAVAGLFIAHDVTFDSMASGCILVVAVAMFGSLTVLPALLSKLGDRVDRPRVPVLWRLTNRGGAPRLWPALLRPALRFPVATLILATIAMLALALPLTHMKLESTAYEDYPKSMPTTQAYRDLIAAFPAEQTSFEIAVQAPRAEQANVTAALTALAVRSQADPLLAHSTPQRQVSADGLVQVLSLSSPYSSKSAQADQALTDLRTKLVPATVGRVAGAQTAVGGDTAANIDYATHIQQRLPWVIGFVLVLTFAVMMLAFGSVPIALLTIAVNLLSAGAAFGALVLVFQHTWAQSLLGFQSTGGVTAWVPMFLFVVLFGLSMDYHVFLVNRIREAALMGMTPRHAVEQGVTRSAGVITSAAVVMVAVFSIFSTLSFIEFKQIGLGLAIAVLLDTLVVRIVILPSALILLGRAAWWPSKRFRHFASAPKPEVIPPVAAR